MFRSRLDRRLAFVVAFFLFALGSVALGAAADDFLAARTDNDKYAIAVKRLGTFTAADFIAIAAKEKNPRAIGYPFGLLLDGKGSPPADVARTLARSLQAVSPREPHTSRLVTIVALSSDAARAADELLNLPPDSKRSNHLLAARVFATAAWAVDQDTRSRAPVTTKKKKAAGLGKKLKKRENLTWSDAFVGRLLAQGDDDTRALAIVGAAYEHIDAIAPKVAELASSRDPAIRAARLLYLARLGLPVTGDDVAAAFEYPPPVKAGCDKPGIALSSYDVRTSPWCNACAALGDLGKEEHLPYLLKALDHRDLRVQIEAAWAMERLGSQKVVEPVLARLPKAEWPVRVALYHVLATIPSRESIPAVIAMLEKDVGRCRIDALYALACLVGDQMGMDSHFHWNEWWRKTEASFQFDPSKSATYRSRNKVPDVVIDFDVFARFYNLTIYSQRFVFTPDTSNSMKGERIDSLKQELGRCIGTISPLATWNVVTFGGLVDTMAEGKLVDSKSIDKARSRVDAFRLSGGTRMYDGLDAAFALPDVEEVVLLTDGAPAGGTFKSWDRLIAGTCLLNRYRSIAVDTMEYRTGAKTVVSPGMRELAARNRGRSVQAVLDKK